MSPNRLKSAALPSMTGRAAYGPTLPSPSTAEPSVITATELRLIESRRASPGLRASSWDTRHTGGVDQGKIIAFADRALAVHGDLAADVGQKDPIGHFADHHAWNPPHHLDQLIGMGGVAGGTGHIDPQSFRSGRGDVTAVILPPASSTAVVRALTDAPPAGTSRRTVIEFETDGTALMKTPFACGRRLTEANAPTSDQLPNSTLPVVDGSTELLAPECHMTTIHAPWSW
jgi:hypothetical protein